MTETVVTCDLCGRRIMPRDNRYVVTLKRHDFIISTEEEKDICEDCWNTLKNELRGKAKK